MSIHPRMDDFGPLPALEPVKTSFWGLVLGYLSIVFSGAKGDQGGWESGARGL